MLIPCAIEAAAPFVSPSRTQCAYTYATGIHKITITKRIQLMQVPSMHKNRHILDVKKNELRQLVLEMSELTVEALERSLQCFSRYAREDAEAIIHNDAAINDCFDHIEHSGFYAIASQQPVAHDLREIIAAMRIATELERIADYAANIARIRLEIAREDIDDLCTDGMVELGLDVIAMFRLAIEAYSYLDTGKAEKLGPMEAQIDVSNTELTNAIFACMKARPSSIEESSRLLWTVHTLERIADRTTNIAEQVIYAVTAHDEKMN